MRKYVITILTLVCALPLYAQKNAEQLLQNTVSKLQKDGGICLTLDVETRFESGTDRADIILKMADGCFVAQSDEFTMWFDGKTLWNGKDFGEGIEEIYITEPTPEEKARYDVINLLGKHKGFSVSGNGTDTFILTATNAERSVEGIRKITVKVGSDATPKSMQIEFDQELGNISATVQITDYKANQKYSKSTFTCPVQEYKDAETVDFR